VVGAAIKQGDPGSEILEFAKSKSAGLIVIGAGGAERPAHPIGSVRAIVVARSDCPVLIVPLGRRVTSQRPSLFERIMCAVALAPSSVDVMKQALSLPGRHMRMSSTCARRSSRSLPLLNFSVTCSPPLLREHTLGVTLTSW
jgi:hypothetical protein